MEQDILSTSPDSCRLILVRHGQARSPDGTYGPQAPLSALGRRQAAAAAEVLVQESAIAAIYSSPWPRALETATILGDRLGCPPMVEDRLAEFEMGTAPLSSTENRPDLFFWQADHRGVPGGETLRAFGARVAAGIEGIVRLHLRERVVVVSHAGTMEAVLRWAVGLSPEAPWQHEFNLPNASLTELECWPGGRVEGGAPRYVSVGAVGATAHLAGLVTDL
jgi:broad specificity phosphatase PhoE